MRAVEMGMRAAWGGGGDGGARNGWRRRAHLFTSPTCTILMVSPTPSTVHEHVSVGARPMSPCEPARAIIASETPADTRTIMRSAASTRPTVRPQPRDAWRSAWRFDIVDALIPSMWTVLVDWNPVEYCWFIGGGLPPMFFLWPPEVHESARPESAPNMRGECEFETSSARRGRVGRR